MTDAPRRVLAFLIGIDLTRYSRDRVARATKLSPRTVDRALGKLVEIGAVKRSRGGRSTPAKLSVIMDMQTYLAHQVEKVSHFETLAHQVGQFGAPNGKNGAPSFDLNLKEVKLMKSIKQQSRALAVENPPEKPSHDGQNLKTKTGDQAFRNEILEALKNACEMPIPKRPAMPEELCRAVRHASGDYR